MLEYMAQCDAAYRQAVVYPAAERRARHEHELDEIQRGRNRPRRHALARWRGAHRLRASARPVSEPAASASRTV